jgi:AGZA family xanthine/uracil permease-like MFS transporter
MTLDFLTIEDIFAAIATLADAIGEGFVALSLGFAAAPTGIGFLVGAVLVVLLRSVVPVSFEVESLTVVSRLCDRDWKRMAQVVLVAGLVGAVLGLLGLYGRILEFIDGPILYGMMTGVGLILSFVAYEAFKENPIIGGVSIAVALGTFFVLINDPNNLIYALIASVAAAILVSRFVEFKPIVDPAAPREKIRLIPLDRFRFLTDVRVIRAALALLALRVGTSIAYSGIDGQLSGTEPNVDHTNIIAGLAGAASAAFGGAPVEPIISGTAAAPNPVTSGALMMVIMGVLLLLGLLPKLARWVPTASIAGFLFLLGAVLAIPGNIGGVVTESDMFSGPVTVAVTAVTFDPFLGMLSGIIVRFVTGLVM